MTDLPTAPHVPGSATSQAAAEAIRPHACRLRMAVLRSIAAHLGLGQTDEEVQESTKLGGNCERPRRRELVVLGYIRDSGWTRPTASGRQATVWVVTNAGLDALMETSHG